MHMQMPCMRYKIWPIQPNLNYTSNYTDLFEQKHTTTPWKTNMVPQNDGLENYCSFQVKGFRVSMSVFRRVYTGVFWCNLQKLTTAPLFEFLHSQGTWGSDDPQWNPWGSGMSGGPFGTTFTWQLRVMHQQLIKSFTLRNLGRGKYGGVEQLREWKW